MTIKNLSERDFVARIWGNNVLEAIDNQHTIPTIFSSTALPVVVNVADRDL